INPQLSFVSDSRYDPCARGSRLGVSIRDLQCAMRKDPATLEGIEGIHFHSNADSQDWSQLQTTIGHLDRNIEEVLRQCRWVNLGGGYLLTGEAEERFAQCVHLLR